MPAQAQEDTKLGSTCLGYAAEPAAQAAGANLDLKQRITEAAEAATRPEEESHDDAWHRDKKIRAAKRAARSELSVSRGEWRKHGYAESDILLLEGLQDTVPRIHWKDLTVEEFTARFEQPRQPVVITGLMDDWPARDDWLPERLAERCGEHKFKVGSDDDGYAVRLKFRWFLEYCTHPEHGSVDDSPLYIFDGTFDDRSGSKSLLQDYRVPPYFQEDLFQHVGEKRRPPYRWMVIGPARSGTGLHIDPLATSAWNALVHGHKRWALFPPGTPKELVKPSEPGLEREAVSWFSKVYPRARHDPNWPAARPIDLIQGPGEIVFVPGGWWHAVLNLDMTVAVTQNYVCSANFDKAWLHTRKGRPKMSAKWLAVLSQVRPDLAARARQLNEADQVMEVSTSSSSSSSSNSSSSSSSSSSDDDDGDSAKTRKVAKQPEANRQVTHTSCSDRPEPDKQVIDARDSDRLDASNSKDVVEPPSKRQRVICDPSNGVLTPDVMPVSPVRCTTDKAVMQGAHSSDREELQARGMLFEEQDDRSAVGPTDAPSEQQVPNGKTVVQRCQCNIHEKCRCSQTRCEQRLHDQPRGTGVADCQPGCARERDCLLHQETQAVGPINPCASSAQQVLVQGRGGHAGSCALLSTSHPRTPGLSLHEGMRLSHAGFAQVQAHEDSAQPAVGAPIYDGWCNHLELKAVRAEVAAQQQQQH